MVYMTYLRDGVDDLLETEERDFLESGGELGESRVVVIH
jgi:hypothetical protein